MLLPQASDVLLFLFCSNKCRTSIVDFHRSCKCCPYDLCLACCSEIRKGEIPGGEEVESVRILQNEVRGMNCVLSKDWNMMDSSKRHARSETTKPCNDIAASQDPNNTRLLWKANSDGSIPCPPEELGGCGRSVLDLKRLFPQNMLSELEERANRVVRSEIFVKAVANRNDQCPCYDHSGKVRKHVVRGCK